jgi:hypothetical protein
VFNKAICFDLSGHHQPNTHNVSHKREIQKCLAIWKLSPQLLQTDIHVHIIKMIEKVVKNS